MGTGSTIIWLFKVLVFGFFIPDSDISLTKGGSLVLTLSTDEGWLTVRLTLKKLIEKKKNKTEVLQKKKIWNA